MIDVGELSRLAQLANEAQLDGRRAPMSRALGEIARVLLHMVVDDAATSRVPHAGINRSGLAKPRKESK